MPKRAADAIESLDGNIAYEFDENPPAKSTFSRTSDNGNDAAAPQDGKPDKERKKKKRKKTPKFIFSDPAIARAPLANQAAFFNKKMASALQDLTSLDLEGSQFKPEFFTDTSTFDAPHDHEHFVEWLKAYGPSDYSEPIPKKAPKGAPRLLVITCHANQAVDLVKASRDLGGEKATIKLFARHIKIGEQQYLLKKFQKDIGVGTPNRILALLQANSLNLDRLDLVVIDCFRDLKDRMLVDMPETCQDFFNLYREFLHARLKDGSTRVAMF
ncbi:cms1 ribosomal small subunit [Dimargaris xerosporica]|nr:cms1 ribosomal small subunit [Dimargaris xerosporica]